MKRKTSKPWAQTEKEKPAMPKQNYFKRDRKEVEQYEQEQTKKGFEKELIQIRPGLTGYVWRRG